MAFPQNRWLALVLIASVAFDSRAGAQSDSTPLSRVPAYRRRLVGVYDQSSGDPVAGVRISDVLSGTSMVTSATGTAALIFVPEGARIIRLQKVGYEAQTMPIMIAEGDTSALTITMRRVTELPAVVTNESAPKTFSPRMRAFEERRRVRAGYFITEDELRREDGKSMATVLTARLPGINFDRRSGNKTMLIQSPRCMDGSKAGPPAVYIDGVQVTEDAVEVRRARAAGAMNSPIDIQRFAVDELAGVEWYPDNSALPAELAHDSHRCGALFLWTRDR